MNAKTRVWAVLALAAVLTAAAAADLAAQGRQAPPEYKELVAAYVMKDPAARLKEFERIKAAYPDSQFAEAIEAGIEESKAALSTTLDELLALQKAFLSGAAGPARLQKPVAMAVQLLNHPLVESFDHTRVLDTALAYRGAALKAAADPAAYDGIPEDQRELFKTSVLHAVELLTARAYLHAGDTDRAQAALESYRGKGGAAGGNYHYVRAGILLSLGQTAEAADAYLSAAAENYSDAAVKARALYVQLHGSEQGFEAALTARLKALPFEPAPFRAPAGWKGKAVLAELFTGSECPPCVAADIAFDGLLESIPSNYLAVLVYHLPIPRPDPMMNPATSLRAGAYGVGSTPTVLIDGGNKSVGGGGRGAAEGRYKQYRDVVETLLAKDPGVVLKARASRTGDKVKVAYDFNRVVSGAEYMLVLVQDEQEHEGSNGVAVHRMVVRDLVVLDPAAPRTAEFDLGESERKTDAYLTDFEKTYTRTPGFKFQVRRHTMPRTGLRAVFFVQEKSSGQVLNAVVAPVL